MKSNKSRTVVRAWTDPVFRASLSEEERKQLPANPAGEVDAEDNLETVMGGLTMGSGCGTLGCFTHCGTGTCTCSCFCTGTCTCYCPTAQVTCGCGG
jgi:mersacidin/lichenicidin family type 2 lantibiotic